MPVKVQKTSLGQVLTVPRFDGGLNRKTSVYDIADNEAVGLVNFIFTEDGLLTTRNGYVKYDNAASFASRGSEVPEIASATGIYGLYRFYKKDGTSKYFVATALTGIYYWDSTNVRWSALTCNITLTSDQRFKFVVLNDYLFMTNGANKPLKWLGGSSAEVNQIGIVAPSAGVSGAVTTGGDCTDGEHNIRITYYNSTDSIESTHRTLTARTCSSGDNTIPLSSLAASSDSQVDKIRVYMTEAAGSIYYLVVEQVDTTTTYSISVSDTTLAGNASYEATNYLPPPTDAKYITAMKRRLFLANNSTYKSRLYWSNVVANGCEYFPTNNYRDINPDDGDVITGIIPWNDYLYIFKQNATYVLTDPNNPGGSYLRDVSEHIGCISPHTLCVGQFKRPVSVGGDWLLTPGIILNSRHGVMGFDGQTFHPLSERVEPILNSLYETNIQEMVGFFNDNKYYLSYTPKEGVPTEGAVVTIKQTTAITSDNATFSTDHDVDNYSSTYDAKITLDNTSASNQNITVQAHVKWESDTYKRQFQLPVYEIFFSYDSGTTWVSKGSFFPDVTGEVYINYYYHSFFDSSVTDVRLDYYDDRLRILNGISIDDYLGEYNVDYVQLVSVEYQYDYTAAVIGSNVVNNRILYYDTLHNAWSELRGIKANCFAAWNSSSDEREEFFGSSNTGYVYRMNVGYEDDGNNIFALYESKHYDCKVRSRKKRFHSLSLSTDIYAGNLNLDVFVDRVQVDHRSFNLLPTGESETYWNEKYFGEAIFDRVINLIQKAIRLPANSWGRFIAIKLWTSGKNSLAIKDYSIRYVEREGFR